MADLSEFLLARYAEDEDMANLGDEDHIPADCWDPGRVEVEIKANRRIVEEHSEGRRGLLYVNHGPDAANHCAAGCGDDVEDTTWIVISDRGRWPCRTLRILASVYADHEDYRAEWAL